MTVGTQLGFDRLIKSVEAWAINADYTDIVFQVGKGAYRPTIGRVHDYVAAPIMDEYFSKATVIVGHAGMGTILTCLSNAKPLVIMPRLLKYNEHRNDHQLATFNKVKKLPRIFPAEIETEISTALNRALNFKQENIEDFCSVAQVELTDYIRKQVNID